MKQYPLTLDPSKDNWIMLYGYDKNGVVDGMPISLYMPPNIGVSDGASYGNFDLGILGQTGQDIATSLMGGGQIPDSSAIKSRLGMGGDDTMSKAVLSQVFTNFGMGSGLVDRGRDIYLQSESRAINPNTVLQYTNSEIRQLQLTFKMVADNKKESNEIKEIVHMFRKYMYGKKEGLTLEYPAKWRVMFFTPTGLNSYIPRYDEMYLESLQTSYNASSNLTHQDGAPSEVDVQLSFREARALSREDIERLHF